MLFATIKNFLCNYKKNFFATIKNFLRNYKKIFFAAKKIFLATIKKFRWNFKKSLLRNYKKSFLQIFKYKDNFCLTFFNFFLSGHSIKWRDSPEIIRTILMQKKPNILRLLSAPGRYIKLRISSIYKKLVKKTKKKNC